MKIRIAVLALLIVAGPFLDAASGPECQSRSSDLTIYEGTPTTADVRMKALGHHSRRGFQHHIEVKMRNRGSTAMGQFDVAVKAGPPLLFRPGDGRGRPAAGPDQLPGRRRGADLDFVTTLPYIPSIIEVRAVADVPDSYKFSDRNGDWKEPVETNNGRSETILPRPRQRVASQHRAGPNFAGSWLDATTLTWGL